MRWCLAQLTRLVQIELRKAKRESSELTECDRASQAVADCAKRRSTDPTIIGVLGPTTSAADEAFAFSYSGTPMPLAGATRRSMTMSRRSSAVLRNTADEYRLGKEAGRLPTREGGSVACIVRPNSLPGADAAKSEVDRDGFIDGFKGTTSGTWPRLPDKATELNETFLGGVHDDAVVAELTRRQWHGTLIATCEIYKLGTYRGSGCATRFMSCYFVDDGAHEVAKSYPIALQRRDSGLLSGRLGW